MSAGRTVVLAHVLRGRRNPLALWGLAVAGVCALYSGLYPSFENTDVEGMMEALPPAMIEALGYNDMTSAAGYIGSATYGLVAFFLLMIFAIMNGAALVAGEEQDGALELELATPLPRATIYLQRLLALWAQLVLLMVIVLGVHAVVIAAASLDVSASQLLAATVQLWLAITLFGTLAFSVGAATGRKGVALGVAVGGLVIGWMMNALGPMLGADVLATLSPVGWYMADNPVIRGWQPLADLASVATTGLLVVGGWRLFERRDLLTT